MKRMLLVLLLCLAALAVTACSGARNKVTVDAIEATVIPERTNTLRIIIGTKAWTYTNGTGYRPVMPEFGPADEAFMDRVVTEWRHQNPWWPGHRPGSNWFWGLCLMALGVLAFMNPRAVWYLSDGWKFRDAEPSELGLLAARLPGIGMVIGGIVLLFV
jgi:hypothetical protein